MRACVRACVCVRMCMFPRWWWEGGGAVFSLGSSVFNFFFRQKTAIAFHSLKAKVFLCGNEGEGKRSMFGK